MGQIHLMSAYGGDIHVKHNFLGTEQFQLFGAQVAFGRPYDNFTDVMAVAATGQGTTCYILIGVCTYD